MSILRCDDCSAIIDTDEDMEAYNEEQDKWLCPACRDDGDDEQ